MNEFELIDVFVSYFDAPSAPHGPGDDCAVLPRMHTNTCVTTDALMEGVHFVRRGIHLEDVGHKALAVNLSDLAAMGARPLWLICGLCVPPNISAQDVRAIAGGMAALARAHGMILLGGNVSRASKLSLHLTVSGKIPTGRQPLLRSGAQPGDVLYASGWLGDAAAGLYLSAKKAVPRTLRAAQQRPSAHVAWALSAAPYASAAIDISDGLVQDLRHLCRASDVGVNLQREALPLSPALQGAVNPQLAVHFALTGGEDYVVVVSVPQRQTRAFQKFMLRCGFAVHRLGDVSPTRGIHIDGKRFRASGGFQHLD